MTQTHEEHCASFQQGRRYGERKYFADQYNQSDKKVFLKALSARVQEELEISGISLERKNQLEGMAHGLRVARLMLGQLGDLVESYNTIIKPTLLVHFTEEDMKKVVDRQEGQE